MGAVISFKDLCISSTVACCVFVCVLRSMHALRPMCGWGYSRGVCTSQFWVEVQFEFLSDSGGEGTLESAVEEEKIILLCY